jgi:hypothetical protein
VRRIPLKEHWAVKVVDLDSGSDAWVLTRVAAGFVGLTLTIESNGDIAVFLPPEAALQVASALTEAVHALKDQSTTER